MPGGSGAEIAPRFSDVPGGADLLPLVPSPPVPAPLGPKTGIVEQKEARRSGPEFGLLLLLALAALTATASVPTWAAALLTTLATGALSLLIPLARFFLAALLACPTLAGLLLPALLLATLLFTVALAGLLAAALRVFAFISTLIVSHGFSPSYVTEVEQWSGAGCSVSRSP